MPSDKVRILIIDDEKQIRRVLTVVLTHHDYDVREAASGDEGLSLAAAWQPDLIVLDLGLPDIDGIEVIRRLREWTQVPIIILSVREDESDKIEALDAGADDYVTKPFAMGELLARVRVALRRKSGEVDEPVITFGELTIDLGHRLVTVRGEKLKLTVVEYEILKCLAVYGGRVVTHAHLLRTVRGPHCKVDSHYLRVYVGQLRRKIEEDPNHPHYIITEPGVGFRLTATG
jgi:two-component system KDP operon response regulator KdpE